MRENELEERSLFSHLRVDKIFILDQIAAFDGYNYIDRPMTLRFIDGISNFDKDKWIEILLRITNRINKRPKLLELTIDYNHMYALAHCLETCPVSIGQILNNPYKDGLDLNILILGIQRVNGDFILLPDENTEFKLNDHILFATTAASFKKFKTIINHYYELYYVLHGVEARRFKIPWIN